MFEYLVSNLMLFKLSCDVSHKVLKYFNHDYKPGTA